ncbi:DNA topoisomerase 3 [Striga asiatica]|uniref:DNA topoisomerase 3 n=1 Tax=Striga asiatica TaxID=4170 RepID=A0A5A7PES7_STRAF|nr:DNA topoisomerase 3 [Striga asiatica]
MRRGSAPENGVAAMCNSKNKVQRLTGAAGIGRSIKKVTASGGGDRGHSRNQCGSRRSQGDMKRRLTGQRASDEECDGDKVDGVGRWRSGMEAGTSAAADE